MGSAFEMLRLGVMHLPPQLGPRMLLQRLSRSGMQRRHVCNHAALSGVKVFFLQWPRAWPRAAGCGPRRWPQAAGQRLQAADHGPHAASRRPQAAGRGPQVAGAAGRGPKP